MALGIKKNDKVKVIAGKDKGAVSRVVAVNKTANRALVENVNMMKKHVRGQGPQRPGSIQEREAPIHLSNLALYCDACKTGVRFGSEEKKERLARYKAHLSRLYGEQRVGPVWAALEEINNEIGYEEK